MMDLVTEVRVIAETALSETEEKESASGHSKGALVCPTCGEPTLRRVARKGFMQRVIYARFGYYPWKCSGCEAAQMMKNRGARHRHRSSRKKEG
jgi:ribosomal protein L37AE/L43A